MQEHCPTGNGRNHDLNSNLVRKRTPYSDAINRYNVNCKGDNFGVGENLICYFLKLSVKFDHVKRVVIARARTSEK